MVQKQLSEAPTPARAYRPDLPAWCEEILKRALAKSPVDRQTAEEFRTALLGAIASAANEETAMYAVPAGNTLPRATVSPDALTIATAVPTPASALASSVPAVPSTPAVPMAVPAEVAATVAVATPVHAVRIESVGPGSAGTASIATPGGSVARPTTSSTGAVATSALPTVDTSAEAPAARPPVAPMVREPQAKAPSATLVMKKQQFAVELADRAGGGDARRIWSVRIPEGGATGSDCAPPTSGSCFAWQTRP